jgi:hypothetical protein
MALPKADLDHRFGYKQASDLAAINRHADVRGACRDAAEAINTNCPEGRERDLAITKLEEAMFWADAAIARQEGPPTE